ncbi:DUF6153 family protein [Streptomyces sp. NPDC026673]|uniref:DUF6153 family protein n=1 Tax=Streptomyces sp. NPDC026673 TaxID=3155724 RepID=UPI0033D51B14
MSRIKAISASSQPQPVLRLPALLVLTVLLGLLGMHALAAGSAMPVAHSGPHTTHHRMTAAEPGQAYACHGTGDPAGHHGAHADQLCVSGAVPGSVVVPALTPSGPVASLPPRHIVAAPPREPNGGRAPPSLAELQLLRI